MRTSFLLLPLVCWIGAGGQALTGSGEVEDEPRIVCKADIVFVLDESNSIWQNDLDKGKRFIAEVIKIFEIGPDTYQVGMISYGSNASIRFDLNQFRDKKKLVNEVLTLPRLHGQTTRTDYALRLLADNINRPSFGSRPGVPKAAIFITDGGSTKAALTKIMSDRVHRMQIHVFGIGVAKDRNLNETELKMIASNPDSRYYFTVENWASLDTIKDQLADKACLVKVTLPPLSTPPTPSAESRVTIPSTEPWKCKQTDVLFVPSDSSGPTNLNHLGKFVKDVSLSLDFRDDKFRIGVLPVPCRVWDGFDLDEYNSQTLITRKIEQWRFVLPDTARVLDEMRRKFTKEEKGLKLHLGPKERVRKVAVVVLDHKSIDLSKTVEQARRAQDEGVEIYVIAVGPHYNSVEANAIASLKLHKHIIRVRSYSQLSAVVQTLSRELEDCPNEC